MSFWFKHSFDSYFSHKQKALRVLRGRDDTNIYWYLIEYLANDDDHEIKVDEIALSIISADLIIDKDHILKYLQDAVNVGLFQQEDKILWSDWLNEQLDNIDSVRQKRAEAGRLGGLVSRRGGEDKSAPKQTTQNNFADDDIEMLMAHYLADKILEISETAKVPSTPQQWQNWAKTFDRLRRLDGRTDKLIHEIIEFATSDPFWQTNVLSADALRRHFDRLVLQSKKQPHSSKSDPKPKARKKLN